MDEVKITNLFKRTWHFNYNVHLFGTKMHPSRGNMIQEVCTFSLFFFWECMVLCIRADPLGTEMKLVDYKCWWVGCCSLLEWHPDRNRSFLKKCACSFSVSLKEIPRRRCTHKFWKRVYSSWSSSRGKTRLLFTYCSHRLWLTFS